MNCCNSSKCNFLGGVTEGFPTSTISFGNICLQSGTDAKSCKQREKFCSVVIPQLLVNKSDFGCIGGDFNCIIKSEDCTRNAESKLSPCLSQAFDLKDSF